MRWLLPSAMLLTMLLAGRAEAAKFCFLFCIDDTAGAVDGFTANYEPVIRSPDDSKIVKNTPDPVRKRIERNDALYRCSTGWKNPICDSLKAQ